MTNKYENGRLVACIDPEEGFPCHAPDVGVMYFSVVGEGWKIHWLRSNHHDQYTKNVERFDCFIEDYEEAMRNNEYQGAIV